MYIVECVLSEDEKTMTFTSDVKFIEFYVAKSVEVLSGKLTSFKVTAINRYIEGELFPIEIVASMTGIRLSY